MDPPEPIGNVVATTALGPTEESPVLFWRSWLAHTGGETPGKARFHEFKCATCSWPRRDELRGEIWRTGNRTVAVSAGPLFTVWCIYKCLTLPIGRCVQSRPVVFQLSDLQVVFPAQQLLIHVHGQDTCSDWGLVNVVNTLRVSAKHASVTASAT